MTNLPETYYCEICEKEFYLNKNEKKVCPSCQKTLLSLECSKEDFSSYSKEERDIVIESSLLRERKKREKQQFQINNPYNEINDEIRKIARDVAITKWFVIGFSILAFLIYTIEEVF